MTFYEKIDFLKKRKNCSEYSERIVSEICCAANISQVSGGKYDGIAEKAADLVYSALKEDGAITKALCLEAEKLLMPLSEEAKSYRVHFVSHAHIDMNWMWGFQETAAVTVDTFTTILDLMREYPELTFSQSQASVYRIIEKYAPDMLEEIKQRIKEGRWEVAASTWVETDKNMPNGESLARHILYTKKYLPKLLDICPDSLNLDFEPDTFGHNISVPEICSKGGVKYYYHCRGNSDNMYAHMWKARSGAQLLVWHDPYFYNGDIDSGRLALTPMFTKQYGVKEYLYVYGVGDHGGGPTRRDVENIIKMSSWPIMPTLVFSTYTGFFGELEKYADKLPVCDRELNFVFTGCYTSQGKIKTANRISEDRLFEAEAVSAASNIMAGAPPATEIFEEAWEQVLFNHFHDILPGSGISDTREYALGHFQDAMAAAGTVSNRSMRALSDAIDSSRYVTEPDSDNVSQGAGVGHAVNAAHHYGLPRAERGVGPTRLYHIFNPTQHDFDGVYTFYAWDWNYDTGLAQFKDIDGVPASFELLGSDTGFWGHTYKTFAVRVKIPAFGYSTYILEKKEKTDSGFNHVLQERTDIYSDAPIVMENGLIKAMFDHSTAQLISLFDKRTNKEMISKPACSFRLIKENTVHGMSSWRVGDRMAVINLNESKAVNVTDIHESPVTKWINYELDFGERSKLKVKITLDDNSDMLDFDVTVDFHEVGTRDTFVPQLNFELPLGYAAGCYRYDIPYGTLDRPGIYHDVPANSFAAAISADGEEKPALLLVSDSRYGFRGVEDTLTLTLLRASYEPDPYPEYGIHNMRIGVGAAVNGENGTLYRAAEKFVHPPVSCSARAGKGSLPLTARLFEVSGDVRVSAVKNPECGEGVVLRVNDLSGKGAEYSLSFFKAPARAYETDISERAVKELPVSGNTVSCRIAPYEMQTVLVKF